MITVIKSSQEFEPYSEEKIVASLRRAHVPKYIHAQVLSEINKRVHDNISTKEIYHEVSDVLGKSEVPFTKSLYRLKQAIMELGPTGYPFEDFVAEVLTTLGYTTKIRQILMGKCITHEVDLIAQKGNSKLLVEAKFHNAIGTRSDVHVPMYTKARFDDLKRKYHLTKAWVITNTKATEDAVAFAECVDMRIVSWDYPEKGCLRDLVEKAGLHPITLLTTLQNVHKQKLLDSHVVRCKTLHENPMLLDTLGMSHDEKELVKQELAFICSGEHEE